MAIYLDANVIHGWRTFDEPERLALSIVAAQLGQKIVVPWVAAEEAAAHHRRFLEDTLKKVETANNAVRRAFGAGFVVDVEPWPDIDGEMERWRAALGEFSSVSPLEDGAARELRREMYGVAPARRTARTGIGGRDAAVWLTIAADHAQRGEDGHFVTGDGDDFARDGLLRPELADELPEDGPLLQLHLGASAFLQLLGTAQGDAAVQLDELARWAEPALIAGLEDSEAILRAVLDRREPSLWYGAGVMSATPTEITRVQRYERAGDAVTRQRALGDHCRAALLPGSAEDQRLLVYRRHPARRISAGLPIRARREGT